MASTEEKVEPVTGLAPEESRRTADGITVEVDTVNGPISIVRTTVKAVGLMQHG